MSKWKLKVQCSLYYSKENFHVDIYIFSVLVLDILHMENEWLQVPIFLKFWIHTYLFEKTVGGLLWVYCVFSWQICNYIVKSCNYKSTLHMFTIKTFCISRNLYVVIHNNNSIIQEFKFKNRFHVFHTI